MRAAMVLQVVLAVGAAVAAVVLAGAGQVPGGLVWAWCSGFLLGLVIVIRLQ